MNRYYTILILILIAQHYHLMGDAEPRATELIISKKSELRNLGSEASVQDIEQSLEAWGQFIERYQAPEDDTQKTQLLDFWETSLTSEQYRWIQITALRHNYADALMSEKLKDVFVESSSKLELIVVLIRLIPTISALLFRASILFV